MREMSDMKSTQSIIGKRFGLRTVILEDGLDRTLNKMFLCRCECGSVDRVRGSALRRGTRVGCNTCSNTTHGLSIVNGKMLPEYQACNSAKQRCTNPRNSQYHRYGGRGIQFRFTCFEEFYAELGQRTSDEHSLDRKNNDGHYEPGNVRWATAQEQALNRRTTRRAA